MFHPDYAKSKANRALAIAAQNLQHVRLVDMYAEYTNGRSNLDREVARLIDASRIVLQFPIMWYSTPPLLKQWQDEVLTRMFYINPETEGNLLKDKPLMVAATAGNAPSAYTASGINLFSLEELIKPLQSTAHRCGLRWSSPFLIYEANKLDGTTLHKHADRYAQVLRDL